MLEQVLYHIHNWFVHERLDGNFSIVGGSLNVPSSMDGQYVRITGSVFSDGLHVCPVEGLEHDEEFTGTVYLLAIPKDVIQLAEDITVWCEDNIDTLNSPYSSESFGGYSYTKTTGVNNSGDGTTLSGWQAQFASRLNPWRKLS